MNPFGRDPEARDRLIEQAARDVRAETLRTGGAMTDIQALIAAGWRPLPTRDVIEGVARALGQARASLEPGPQEAFESYWRAKAEALAGEGYLRTPEDETDETDTTEAEFDAMFNQAVGVQVVQGEPPLFQNVRHKRGFVAEIINGPDQEFVSIPVPPPADLVEKLAEAIWSDAWVLTTGFRSWPLNGEDIKAPFRAAARSVFRALGEA